MSWKVTPLVPESWTALPPASVVGSGVGAFSGEAFDPTVFDVGDAGTGMWLPLVEKPGAWATILATAGTWQRLAAAIHPGAVFSRTAFTSTAFRVDPPLPWRAKSTVPKTWAALPPASVVGSGVGAFSGEAFDPTVFDVGDAGTGVWLPLVEKPGAWVGESSATGLWVPTVAAPTETALQAAAVALGVWLPAADGPLP